MPEISRFYGVVIRMYFNDHVPPHFHAVSGGSEAEVTIVPVTVRTGHLPSRSAGMVLEWASLHQAELLENWRRLHSDEPPTEIPPLP